jgi:phage terminase large subunit-like protein
MAALLGLVKLIRGRATGAKVSCAATTEKQCKNVFEPAQESLRLSPDVARAAGLVVCEHNIRGVGDCRIFECVSAEKRSADGRVDDLVIVDEVHQHPTRALYDVLCQNASKVDGACVLAITTAGTDQSPTAIGWILHQEARDILAGKLDNPTALAFISAADRDRDPWDERTWKQANLNYGVSVSRAGFRAAVKSIQADPGGQPHFFATRLGWWQQNTRGWMDMAAWDRCARPGLRIEDYADQACCIGVDLAAVGDLTAVVRLFVTLGKDGQRNYAMFAKAWLPEGSQTLTTSPDVKLLADHGHVTLTPGDVMDFGIVREDVLAGPYGAEVCYDPWNATQLATDLMAEGVTAVEVRQGARTQSAPMKELQAAVLAGRLVHDGSPAAAYCFSNVLAVADANDNIRPMRSGEHKRIDVATAAINAMVRAMVIDVSTPVSLVWDPLDVPYVDSP